MKRIFNSVEEFAIWVNSIGIKVFSYSPGSRTRDPKLANDDPFKDHIVITNYRLESVISIINSDIAIKDLLQRVKKHSIDDLSIETYYSQSFQQYSINIRWKSHSKNLWEEIYLDTSIDESVINQLTDQSKLLQSVLDGSYYK